MLSINDVAIQVPWRQWPTPRGWSNGNGTRCLQTLAGVLGSTLAGDVQKNMWELDRIYIYIHIYIADSLK